MTTTTVSQDLWHSQHDALADLTAFVAEHAPDAEHPLPLLHWSVGPSRTVHAEVHALDREHGGGHRDPRAVLTAYCDVLGVEVMERQEDGKARLVAHGRIGPPDSAGGAGRTHLVIGAIVPIGQNPTGGRAFVP